VPHGIKRVFNTILYENEFQNPHILMDTLEITLVFFLLLLNMSNDPRRTTRTRTTPTATQWILELR
jgi:hypothetical protein